MRVKSGNKKKQVAATLSWKFMIWFSNKNNFLLLRVDAVQRLRRESHYTKSNLLLKNPHAKDKNCEFSN
jgi:hypothetical protein